MIGAEGRGAAAEEEGMMGFGEFLHRVWKHGLRIFWWTVRSAIQELCEYIRWEWRRWRRG